MAEHSKELPLDYSKIDTSTAQRYSDEQLLRSIKGLDWANANVGGWGVVAELAKRYSDTKDIPYDI